MVKPWKVKPRIRDGKDCYIKTETLNGKGFSKITAGFRVFFKGIYIDKLRKFQGLFSKLKNFFDRTNLFSRDISYSFISVVVQSLNCI